MSNGQHSSMFLCNGESLPDDMDGVPGTALDYRPQIGNANVRLGLPDFVQSVYHLPDRFLDLLEIAAYVFAGDRLTLRGSKNTVEYHSWARNLHYVMRVRDHAFWSRSDVQDALRAALLFMTGDQSYDFTFQPGHSTPPADLFDSEVFQVESADSLSVMLFSGGLDSLAGAVQRLEETNDRVCLVSHQSSQPSIVRTQDSLVKALQGEYPGRVHHYRFRTNLRRIRAKEETQRTRSFLYGSIAFAIAHTFGRDRVFVYENGITSLNFTRLKVDWMYKVGIYLRVRKACFVEGMSVREAARVFGLHRDTVRKMLEYSVPPGYRRQRPARRPKLDPYKGVMDQILEQDLTSPKKQRHTAKRIYERLRDEHGFPGKYTIVKDYVRERRSHTREMFLPLSRPPGHAQCDYGEARVIIGGVERKAHYFALDIPHSDGCYVKAYPAETTESFCDGHVSAFAFLGGVPQSILYDNTTLAVARILGDGHRQRTRVFSELQSHYLFEDRFGRPGKGNDKGKVEGLVGYVHRNFLVPIPSFESFDALNAHLEQHCLRRFEDRLRGHNETIEERLERDLEKLLPLPAVPYDASDKHATRVSSLSLVRYRTNDYSVPVAYGHRDVLVRGYVHEVVISCGAEVIARHRRSYDRDDFVFDPLHYLPLLEKKTRALDQAAPLVGWELPEEFGVLRRLLESRMGKRGKREFVQVLRLMENFQPEEVHDAVRDAIRLGAVSFDAVKHLVLCRIEGRPPRLDMELYPYLPRTNVATTSTRDYMALLAGSRS